jgi:hypothetical protein
VGKEGCIYMFFCFQILNDYVYFLDSPEALQIFEGDKFKGISKNYNRNQKNYNNIDYA